MRYDLTSVKRAVARADLARRPADLWRYREMLPIDEPGAVISLGESMTPLLVAPRLGAALGVNRLYIKDESRLPTGSFKARGMAVAVSRATRHPSYLYNLLKRNAPLRSTDLIVTAAAVPLVPVAALLELGAGMAGRGGTIAVLARRD